MTAPAFFLGRTVSPGSMIHRSNQIRMRNTCDEGLRRVPPTYFPHRKLRSSPLHSGTSPARYCKYDISRIPSVRDVLPGSHRASSCLPDIR